MRRESRYGTETPLLFDNSQTTFRSSKNTHYGANNLWVLSQFASIFKVTTRAFPVVGQSGYRLGNCMPKILLLFFGKRVTTISTEILREKDTWPGIV